MKKVAIPQGEETYVLCRRRAARERIKRSGTVFRAAWKTRGSGFVASGIPNTDLRHGCDRNGAWLA